MANKWGLVLAVLVAMGCGFLGQACSAGSDSCVESRSCRPESPAAAAGTAGSRPGEGRAADGGASGAGSGASGASGASEGGDAGDASGAKACATDAECDDHARCNGSESCLGGACRAGEALRCENAATCVEGANASPCVYPDPSAWLVYAADEDTPAVPELYAVKESLIGAQQPIKISAPLPHAPLERLTPYSFAWSADGRWLSFGTTEKGDTVSTRWYAVRFDRGAPEGPIALAPGLPPVSELTWSPTGHELLLQGSEGKLSFLHLGEQGSDPPVQLSASSQVVTFAFWATSTMVVYGTKGGSVYRVPVAGQVASPTQFTNIDGTFAVDFGWASSNGAWAVFLTSERVRLLANVGSAQMRLLSKGAVDQSYVSFQFSPDSNYLVYAASEQKLATTELYLIELWSAALARTTIESGQTKQPGDLLGRWGRDSNFFTYFSDAYTGEPERLSINVYDLFTKERATTAYDIGIRDRGAIGVDETSVLFSTQHTPTSSSELVGIGRDGSAQYFDEDAAGRPYSSAEFAADGSGALYCTTVTVGTDQVSDMVYADLRGAFRNLSVRVPGEGAVYSCSQGFAPDSKGFAYYRLAPDGARVLYWVDTTKQVMSKPRQISRDGRVREFQWQRSTNVTP